MRPPVQVEPQPDLAGGWELMLLEALRSREREPLGAAASPQDRRAKAQVLIDQAIQAVLDKEYDVAVEALEQAGRLDPENPSIQPRLARLYARNSAAR
jgi:hypothetical protein